MNKIIYDDKHYIRWEIGDCLELMKKMPDKSIDLILTDIPYNISQKSQGLRRLDYGDWDKQKGMEKEWIKSMLRIIRGTLIVFCGKKQLSGILIEMELCGLINRPLIWKKPNPTVLNCNRHYIEATEFMAYGKCHGAYFRPNYKHNLFEYQAPHTRLHPTQKPIELIEELILDTTKVGDTILDPFLGSGTTLLACRNTGRNGIGFDINPDYELIIKERTGINQLANWEEYF